MNVFDGMRRGAVRVRELVSFFCSLRYSGGWAWVLRLGVWACWLGSASTGVLPVSLLGWGVGQVWDKAAGGNLEGMGGGENGAGIAVVVPGFRFMGRYSLGRLDTKVCVVVLHLPLGGFRGLLSSLMSQQ